MKNNLIIRKEKFYEKGILVGINLLRRIVVDIPVERDISEDELTKIICEEIGKNCIRYVKEWAVDFSENIEDIKDDKEVPYGYSYEEKYNSLSVSEMAIYLQVLENGIYKNPDNTYNMDKLKEDALKCGYTYEGGYFEPIR